MKKTMMLFTLGLCMIAGTCFFFAVYKTINSEKQRQAYRKNRVTKESAEASKRRSAWARLKKEIAHELKSFNGLAGIVIKDLDMNWEINTNKDLRIPSASMVKIPIMMSCFYAANEGKVDLNYAVKIRNSEKAPGSGTLKNETVGKAFAIEDLIRRMITESDNTATNMLINYFGFDALNRYFSVLGLSHTNLSRKMMDFKGRGEGVENYTTAGDMAHLLEALYRGRFINADISKRCIDIMARQKVNDRIPKKLPAGITVAHKTGLENFLCHDAGIVYSDKGNFLICVLTKHNNKTAQESKSLIADISLLVYNYYGDF